MEADLTRRTQCSNTRGVLEAAQPKGPDALGYH